MSICTYPGCNTLVLKGRCARHPYPQSNNRSHRRKYSKRWSDIRASVLKVRPYCEYKTRCDGAPATEVDHRDNDRQNNHSHNLVASCKRCHSYKTATEDMKRDEDGRFTVAQQGGGGS